MRLVWRHFDQAGLQRIVRLINKSNQFNLTTRRHTTDQVIEVMNDPAALGLQLRLIDRFGDNVIAIISGRPKHQHLCLDRWIMSCRVLGRQVEQATLSVIMSEAKRLGVDGS
jgi:FkbH-like protein